MVCGMANLLHLQVSCCSSIKFFSPIDTWFKELLQCIFPLYLQVILKIEELNNVT